MRRVLVIAGTYVVAGLTAGLTLPGDHVFLREQPSTAVVVNTSLEQIQSKRQAANGWRSFAVARSYPIHTVISWCLYVGHLGNETAR